MSHIDLEEVHREFRRRMDEILSSEEMQETVAFFDLIRKADERIEKFWRETRFVPQ
jgi:hypothetical protein